MKTIILFMLMSIFSFSQSFNGINLGRPYAETKIALETKGFKFIEQKKPTTCIFNGLLNGFDVEILVLTTPKTKIVWKFYVKIARSYSWESAERSFEKYLDIMTENYGETEDKFTIFKDPYYEGDGYEIQALYKEKCNYDAFWETPEKNNISVGLRCFDGETVLTVLQYENLNANQLKKEEESEINNKIF